MLTYCVNVNVLNNIQNKCRHGKCVQHYQDMFELENDGLFRAISVQATINWALKRIIATAFCWHRETGTWISGESSFLSDLGIRESMDLKIWSCWALMDVKIFRSLYNIKIGIHGVGIFLEYTPNHCTLALYIVDRVSMISIVFEITREFQIWPFAPFSGLTNVGLENGGSILDSHSPAGCVI